MAAARRDCAIQVHVDIIKAARNLPHHLDELNGGAGCGLGHAKQYVNAARGVNISQGDGVRMGHAKQFVKADQLSKPRETFKY